MSLTDTCPLLSGLHRSKAWRCRANIPAYWIDKGILGLNGMIGCFAMTELAHGSNVAGLETTATFDEETDEFIIHTPHLGATKWWIGGAASTATHAAVFAQMIIKGKRHGVKTFVTQLRDTKCVFFVVHHKCGAALRTAGRYASDACSVRSSEWS